VGSRKPMVFVAVPCGDFYSVQTDIIREVRSAAGVDCYIAEDSPDTKGLWDSISAQIDGADVFIADISSASPNILLGGRLRGRAQADCCYRPVSGEQRYSSVRPSLGRGPGVFEPEQLPH
jgi:hypothetical protein